LGYTSGLNKYVMELESESPLVPAVTPNCKIFLDTDKLLIRLNRLHTFAFIASSSVLEYVVLFVGQPAFHLIYDWLERWRVEAGRQDNESYF
jgi:hypothetical protein